MKISRRSLMKSAAVLPAALGGAGEVMAQQAQYTPDDLKSTLTPFGGLRAGNAEGTIPAWTGELIPLPAGYVAGHSRPDPFAGEAPLVTITAANMAQYQDKLTQGDIYLLQTYPDYKLIIYPTHRTAIAPQFVYDYTYKNASTAQISADGNSVSNAYGGVPFPIPTTGKQIMWNHLLRWSGVTISNPTGIYQITASGELIMRSYQNAVAQYPYYFNGRESEYTGIFQQVLLQDTAPAYVEGEAVMFDYPVNPIANPPRGWEYELGERRVRLAPQLQYDTPIDISGGVLQWDEGGMFNGALDQYDCKIVGKKEMYVPYNCNRVWSSRIRDVCGPKHVNSDLFRWELHRVWIVEMTLAPGKRNLDARRVCYVDEDTWTIMAMDIYDASGSLWKYHHSVEAICSDIPALASGYYLIAYDFHSREYVAFSVYDGDIQWQPIPELPPSYFTPGELAALAGGS